MTAPPRPSAARHDRLLVLARKLEDRLVLNTAASRADCRALALEIIQLLDDEDSDAIAQPAPGTALDPEVVARLAEALRTCRDASEQAELTRLFTMSERIERQASGHARVEPTTARISHEGHEGPRRG